jgi:3-oxoacyl-[acyl-carrier protein] reductase
MNLSLNGKNALVCGGSKGIGKAIAIELALLGANVTLAARDAEALKNTLSQLHKGASQDHDLLIVDLSDLESLKTKLIASISDRHYHILINNTGGPAGGPILNAEPAAFAAAFAQHILTAQIVTQLVVPGMLKSSYGRIINVISTSVKEPIDGLGVSNTIRGAMGNWAKTMALELGRHGITVNNLLPGFTETERLRSLIASRAKVRSVDPSVIEEEMKGSVPMGRFGEPEELGAVAAFLASPAAAYVNGINIPVDGGRTKSL